MALRNLLSFNKLRARWTQRSEAAHKLPQNDQSATKTQTEPRHRWLCPNFGIFSNKNSSDITTLVIPGTSPLACSPVCPLECDLHSTTNNSEDLELTKLEQAWFQRRASSLVRQSAKSLVFEEEVRSPRPARCYEYTPLNLAMTLTSSVTSAGVEMEMIDFTDMLTHLISSGSNVELFVQSAGTPISPIAGVSVKDYGTGKYHFNADSVPLPDSPMSLISPLSESSKSPASSPQYRPKHRPNPINIFRPIAVGTHQCDISDTPFTATMAGQWPNSPSTPGSSRTTSTSASVRRKAPPTMVIPKVRLRQVGVNAGTPVTAGTVESKESQFVYEWY